MIQKQVQHMKLTHLCCFTSCSAFFLLPFLLLLLQLFNAFFQHIGPEITFKVRQLLGTRQPVFSCLFEDVLLRASQNIKNKYMETTLKRWENQRHDSVLHRAVLCFSLFFCSGNSCHVFLQRALNWWWAQPVQLITMYHDPQWCTASPDPIFNALTVQKDCTSCISIPAVL